MAGYEAFPNEDTDCREFAEDASATYKIGACVLLAADEEIEECGADPAAIMGVALHDAGNHPLPGRCLVAVASSEHATFFFSGTRDPLLSDRNQKYGLVKDAGGNWVIDLTDTVATRVYVKDVDLTRGLYHVTILEANRQAAG
jgi:hypothetical protein